MRQKFSDLNPSERYHIMTQVVIPRPIAWVLTANDADQASTQASGFNLAPFSYFNAISSDPPLVMMSIGKKADGEQKDTRANFLQQKSMVIHIPSAEDMQAVSDSAETLPYGDSEIEKFGLALVEEQGWSLPRLAQCRVAMLCTYYDVIEIGPNQQAILFCKVEDLYLDDDLVQRDSRDRLVISAESINPLSRLGANQYAAMGDVLHLARPK